MILTEKFILKILEKSISCAKLREQYKLITAKYGCSYNFKRTKNCYLSSVLHAIKNSGEEEFGITELISRTISKEYLQTDKKAGAKDHRIEKKRYGQIHLQDRGRTLENLRQCRNRLPRNCKGTACAPKER